jgi:hypothetical protein
VSCVRVQSNSSVKPLLLDDRLSAFSSCFLLSEESKTQNGKRFTGSRSGSKFVVSLKMATMFP